MSKGAAAPAGAPGGRWPGAGRAEQAGDAPSDALVIMGRAGWHIANELTVPANLTPVFLPAPDRGPGRLYSPELDAIERVWLYLRERDLSHRLRPTYDAILDACCVAWNRLRAEPGRIRSLAAFPWLQTPGTWWGGIRPDRAGRTRPEVNGSRKLNRPPRVRLPEADRERSAGRGERRSCGRKVIEAARESSGSAAEHRQVEASRITLATASAVRCISASGIVGSTRKARLVSPSRRATGSRSAGPRPRSVNAFSR